MGELAENYFPIIWPKSGKQLKSIKKYNIFLKTHIIVNSLKALIDRKIKKNNDFIVSNRSKLVKDTDIPSPGTVKKGHYSRLNVENSQCNRFDVSKKTKSPTHKKKKSPFLYKYQ